MTELLHKVFRNNKTVCGTVRKKDHERSIWEVRTMTLNEYMRKHFFDRCKPYRIIKEDGTELNIGWEEYDKYEFVKYVPGEDEDTVIVK